MLVFVFVFAPLLYLIYVGIKRNYHGARWEEGIFNNHLPFERDNILEAYICLAARMIQRDRKDAAKKIQYMNQYFSKRFPGSNYNFGESLSFSFKHPIKVYTVTNWINRHLRKKEYKIQILYFLAGISMVDGEFNKGELKLLQGIAQLLKLSNKDFDSVVNMYHSYEQKSEKTHSTTSKKSIREICCKILGVSVNASQEEIKTAYRNMAKLHHPDRFHNESKEQQEIAEEKFIKIKKAYEALR